MVFEWLILNPNKINTLKKTKKNNQLRYIITQSNKKRFTVGKSNYEKYILPKIRTERKANITPFMNIIKRDEFFNLDLYLNNKNFINSHETDKYKLITYINKEGKIRTATIKKDSPLENLIEL